MSLDFILPEPLDQYLYAAYGVPLSVERLGGKSGASVYRMRFARSSLIIKVATQNTETRFYQQVAPILRANGIPLPALEAAYGLPESYWLVLEDIPHPLPRERWHGDVELIGILARLHRSDVTPLPEGFVPEWTSETTEKALACFDAASAAQLRPALERLQEQGQALFQPEAPISGDPNPGNWGLREGGTAVLFDWERFTRAAPAIDLAIIIAGLGDREQFRQVAAAYRRERGDYPLAVEALAEQIALAKVWVVVEYLSLYGEGIFAPDAMLASLTEQFPMWLKALDISDK